MISTLWNIRTEALMLEEGLSTILIAPLTGEVKDVGVNEVVGLASDDETEVVENASDDCCFHGVNPFFPWRSSLGVMPYALGVTISAGTVLCVSHPGWEPAMAALRCMLLGIPGLTNCQSGTANGSWQDVILRTVSTSQRLLMGEKPGKPCTGGYPFGEPF